MKYGFKRRLNIKDYTKNAQKNFSVGRLFLYTALSVALTVMLFVTSINEHYEGTAFIFTWFVFVLILGFTVLNIIALINKIKDR